MSTKAAEKRFAAINALVTDVRYVKHVEGAMPTVVWTQQHAARAVVAAAIREMLPLGRTERWQDAVAAWAREVEASTEETFRWAFDQFAVWACYAAE
jgi:hypothetical protein